MPRSITTAADSGNTSLVKNVTVCLTLSSYTLKSVASSPSTILPSGSFTVTGTLMKLTFTCNLKSSSKSLPGAPPVVPAGTVFTPCDPGKGASGFNPGAGWAWSPPDRVFGWDCGLSLDGAAAAPSSLIPGTGAVGSFVGAGALFCGLGASGRGCCWPAAKVADMVTTASNTANWTQVFSRSFDMMSG